MSKLKEEIKRELHTMTIMSNSIIIELENIIRSCNENKIAVSKTLENLNKIVETEDVSPVTPPIIPPTNTKNKFEAAKGKGAFLYYLDPIYKEEGGIDKAVAWMKKLGMNNIWIRILGKAGWSATQTKQQAKDFVKACREAGIVPGAWGYEYQSPENVNKYASYINEYMRELGLDLYVHNVEKEWEDSSAIVEEEYAKRYFSRVIELMPDICHGLSTFWNPQSHPNMPWKVFSEYCDFFAPQAYHVTKNPIDLINKAISLNNIFNKPINVTIQGFWGEMGIGEQGATRDFETICNSWNTGIGLKAITGEVIGITFWHLGGKGCAAFNEMMEESWRNFTPNLFRT